MSNERKRLQGLVTSAKMSKTVKVRVDRSYLHPLYGKVVRTHKFYLVHDELGCQPGDEVLMVESRPMSRRKHWAVQEIIQRASAAEIAAKEEVLADEPDIELAEETEFEEEA
jgi:small subunit ribosomal protein S17